MRVPRSSPLCDEGDCGLHCRSVIHHSMRRADKTCLCLQRGINPSPLSLRDLSWCWSALGADAEMSAEQARGAVRWISQEETVQGLNPSNHVRTSEEFEFFSFETFSWCAYPERLTMREQVWVQHPAQGHFDRKHHTHWLLEESNVWPLCDGPV